MASSGFELGETQRVLEETTDQATTMYVDAGIGETTAEVRIYPSLDDFRLTQQLGNMPFNGSLERIEGRQEIAEDGSSASVIVLHALESLLADRKVLTRLAEDTLERISDWALIWGQECLVDPETHDLVIGESGRFGRQPSVQQTVFEHVIA